MASDVLPDADSEFGQRVRARLRDEQVIWFTTVGADGTPQPNPVWFIWQGPGGAEVAPQVTRSARASRVPGQVRRPDDPGER